MAALLMGRYAILHGPTRPLCRRSGPQRVWSIAPPWRKYHIWRDETNQSLQGVLIHGGLHSDHGTFFIKIELHMTGTSQGYDIGVRTWAGSLVQAVLPFVAAALSLALFLSPLLVPRLELKLAPGAISSELGFAYIAPLRIKDSFLLHFPGDELGSAASELELREDGGLLGPAHSLHVEIRSKGGGRFSHWNDWLYFSTSDGSDPRTNGRSYTATVAPRLSAAVWIGVLLADALVVFCLRNWLLSLLVRYGRVLAAGAMVATICAAIVLAAGFVGVVNPTGNPPKDPYLVLAVVGHVVLACALTLAQWSMGAGVARALLPKFKTSYGQILLLGFPLSLVLLALLIALALLAPYGRIAVLLLWALSLWPLFQWPIERAALASLVRMLPGLLAVSIAFGCWMALLWHGPTEAIPGMPLGDLVFYASSVWAIAANPIERPDLGYEGDVFSYFNALIPAIGAALAPVLPLDGFLLMCSTAAIAVLGSGLALHAYLTERPPQRMMSLETFALVLAFVAAGRTPSWIVQSPIVAYVVPLTIAVWFWTVRGRESVVAGPIALASSIAGSALTKVVSAGTLVPLVLAGLVLHLGRTPRILQVIIVLLTAAGIAYAAYMLTAFLPSFIALVDLGAIGIGPTSYHLVTKWGLSLNAAWPWVVQDVGILLMTLVAFRLVYRLEAAALAFGLILVLTLPFLTFANFICVVVVLALAAIDDPASFRRSWWLVISAFLLTSPPMIFTDEAGLATGLLWSTTAAAVVFLAISSTNPERRRSQPERRRHALLVSTVLIVTGLGLIASARGTLVLSSGFGAADLTPEVRDNGKQLGNVRLQMRSSLPTRRVELPAC
jgi:hypothetical protein